MGDRTPAAGPARLTDADFLASLSCPNCVDLVAALRAAWAENARYRAALEDQRHEAAAMSRALWGAGYHALSAEGVDVMVARIDAALAAPGAGEGGEA